MEETIKLLKLHTGEELVTKVTGDSDGVLHLESPMMVEPIGTSTHGNVNVGISPWICGGDATKISLESKYVLLILNANPAIRKAYISATLKGYTL